MFDEAAINWASAVYTSAAIKFPIVSIGTIVQRVMDLHRSEGKFDLDVYFLAFCIFVGTDHPKIMPVCTVKHVRLFTL